MIFYEFVNFAFAHQSFQSFVECFYQIGIAFFTSDCIFLISQLVLKDFQFTVALISNCFCWKLIDDDSVTFSALQSSSCFYSAFETENFFRCV